MYNLRVTSKLNRRLTDSSVRLSLLRIETTCTRQLSFEAVPYKGEIHTCMENLIPVKFCHLEGNYAIKNRAIHKKSREIWLFLLEILPIFSENCKTFSGWSFFLWIWATECNMKDFCEPITLQTPVCLGYAGTVCSILKDTIYSIKLASD